MGFSLVDGSPKSTSDIATLKTRQGEHSARKQALLAQFAPFRDGVFDRLEEWTKEAAAQGLEGVIPAARSSITSQATELVCAINGFQLVFIASERAMMLELPNTMASAEAPEVLATRILIYVRDNEERQCDLDMFVCEDTNEVYVYQIRRFDPDNIAVMDQGQPSELKGRRAADKVIRFVCGFYDLWVERPTLGRMRQAGGGSRQVPSVQWRLPDSP